jgi:hypothetical protein
MLTIGHNGTISMGATFRANDMKYHLFTLMGFDAHHNKNHITWVITSRQIVGFGGVAQSFEGKDLGYHAPNWKPSCFINDDTPQESWWW